VALLQLCGGKIDVDAVNHVGQSALHVNAHRGNLGCVFTLAANGINLDLQDNNGDTGLHIAVSVCSRPLHEFVSKADSF
jgi:ankyrin repeat protein